MQDALKYLSRVDFDIQNETTYGKLKHRSRIPVCVVVKEKEDGREVVLLTGPIPLTFRERLALSLTEPDSNSI